MIFKWIINAAILFLVAFLYPGIIIGNFYAALIAILILGLVNLFIKPLILLLTLPLNVLTLGLFTFVINGFMFWLVSTIVKGFDVASFWSAVVGALLYSIISWLLNGLLEN